MSSADNLGKQFGPRSGLKNRQGSRAGSGSKLFDTLMVYLKEFFQNVNFEKNQQTIKKHEKLPSMQWANWQMPIWAMSWENQHFAYAKTKTQISFAVTAKLISAFVFAS